MVRTNFTAEKVDEDLITSIMRWRSVITAYGIKSAFATVQLKDGGIRSKELDDIVDKVNQGFEKQNSRHRVFWDMGEIMPSTYMGELVR